MGDRRDEAANHLATYLRDHRAGAAGGLSLIRRSAKANAGTALGRLLDELHGEISADCSTLEDVMGRLGVSRNPVKTWLAPIAEGLRRVKVNRHPLRYSALDKVVELELLASAIDAKRNLWRALSVVAEHDRRLDADHMRRMIERSAAQHARVLEAHPSVAAEAFVASDGEPR